MRDVESYGDLIDQLSAGADPECFVRAALDAYATLVGYDTAVFSWPNESREMITVGVDAAMRALIDECDRNREVYCADLQPAITAAGRTGAALDHQVYSFRDRTELPLFREVIAPQGIRSLIMLTPRTTPGVMIRLQRHGGTAFDQRDMERALAPLRMIELFLTTSRRSSVLDRLTPREREVASHLARGLTTPQIAQILGTSPLTVRNQIGRIFDKTGTASRSELAALIAREL